MSEPTKIVFYPAPEKVYAPEELAEVFAPYTVHDPVAVALRQILQQRMANAMVDSATARMSEREAGHAGGRVQEIMDLSSEIFGYMGGSEEGSRRGTKPQRRQ